MHVLIIPSEEFVPDHSPTAGIFQYHQAAILKQKNFKVGVISISQSFSIPMILKGMFYKIVGRKTNNATDNFSFFDLIKLGYNKTLRPTHFLKVEEKEGINVLRIDGFYFGPPKLNMNDFGWMKAGKAAFEKYINLFGTPDIIHAHNAIYAGMLAKELKNVFGIPYIITEHSTAFKRNLIKEKKVLIKVSEAYNESSALYAVSDSFAQLLNQMFKTNKFLCLPNVLDPFLEQQAYKANGKNNNEFIFLNIAELHPKKDHLTLIKAFKKITIKYGNVKLWIGGDGQLSNELKNFVSKEVLNDKVILLGALDRKEVFERIMHSNCFVLSSKYETFGVVVIEAMLFGKPVIVTRCGGPESFVNNDLGLVIDADNELQLVEAMDTMIQNYSVYKHDDIRNFTISEFGKERFFERINEAYKTHVN
jgi:glycosyltransferase involved in cell wall biosynthesis